MKNGIMAFFCTILLSLGAAMTASAGSVIDTDGDAVPDLFDNCSGASPNAFQASNPFPNGPFAATGSCDTPVQLDTDGDGYGNPCDGDFNNDVIPGVPGVYVDATDTLIFFSELFDFNAQSDLNCSGQTDASDLIAYFGLLFGMPGPGATATP